MPFIRRPLFFRKGKPIMIPYVIPHFPTDYTEPEAKEDRTVPTAVSTGSDLTEKSLQVYGSIVSEVNPCELNQMVIATKEDKGFEVDLGNLASFIGHACTSFAKCFGFYAPKPKIKQREAMTQKLKECLALVNSQNDDIAQIENELNSTWHDSDAAFAESRKIFLSPKAPLYTINQTHDSFDRNIVTISTLLQEISHLLRSYRGIEDKDTKTIEDLDLFYKERDEHHQALLGLLKAYFPEVYAAIKESKHVLRTDIKH